MKLEKTKTYQRTNCSFPRIGPVEIETPRGRVLALDAPGLMTMEIRDGDQIRSIAILVYEPMPGAGTGLVVQCSADNARAVAASLMAMADRIEPVTNAQ